ncbi:zinc-binding dehydrogenase [Pseudomonas sp. RL_5y_Pfl2_73]|uniref:zinc-binding dehydrogenase n=1 Tax=Pseudomonas sp. RL_5y_Pfl2_73 TaxID=3088713 RepID=UPI0030DA8B07
MSNSMKCAVVREYGSASEVLKIESLPVPDVGPDEVLVRQYATSVNPIDCRVREGYGRVVFTKMRGFGLPLVLGRDVSGEVLKIGTKVKSLAVRDAVYGISSTKSSGAYSQYVVAKSTEVVRKPVSLSYEEAASFPYVVCTVWDALVVKAGLNASNAKGKQVFVQGGAGGIGSFAIQLLKSWGAHVATTCNKTQMESVRALGADVIIDYELEDYAASLSGYDVALETVGGALEERTLNILNKEGTGVFVTIIHPLLKTFDEYGLLKGAIKNFVLFQKHKRYAKKIGVHRYYWATFKPNESAMLELNARVGSGDIRPHIGRVFKLDEIVAAQQCCEQGKSNGKIIVKIE